MNPVTVEPRDPAFYRDPFAWYRHWHRSRAAFHWSAYGHLCFAAHADVSALLRDRRFGRQLTLEETLDARPDLEAFDAIERHSMLELEPPRHTTLRRAVNRSFVSRHITPLGPFVERRAGALIDAFPSDQAFDLLPNYATPLPVETIATMLGIELEHADRLLEWSHAMVAVYAFRDDGDVRHAANEAARAFGAFANDALDRAASSGHGLLGRLATDGDITRREAISTAILLLNAGHEATVHQIGNAVRTLLHVRDAGFALHDWIVDDDRLDRLIEECLRIASPLHLFTRFAYETCDWTDADGRAHRIERGDTVGLLLGAANHDPRRFDDPAAFDPGRARLDHVAFGGGIHFCLGAPLARLELRIALRALFTRLPSLRLAEEPVVADTFHFHGLERLMVRAG